MRIGDIKSTVIIESLPAPYVDIIYGYHYKLHIGFKDTFFIVKL